GSALACGGGGAALQPSFASMAASDSWVRYRAEATSFQSSQTPLQHSQPSSQSSWRCRTTSGSREAGQGFNEGAKQRGECWERAGTSHSALCTLHSALHFHLPEPSPLALRSARLEYLRPGRGIDQGGWK